MEIFLHNFANLETLREGWPILASGLWMTFKLVLVIVPLSVMAGLIVAMLQGLGLRWLNAVLIVYVDLLRACALPLKGGRAQSRDVERRPRGPARRQRRLSAPVFWWRQVHEPGRRQKLPEVSFVGESASCGWRNHLPGPQTHQKRSRRGEMRSAGEDGEMSGRAGFPAGFGYIYLQFNDQNPLTNPL